MGYKTSEEKRAYARAYYHRNRDKIREQNKKRRQDPESATHKDNRTDYSPPVYKKWYEKNRRGRVAERIEENWRKRLTTIYGITEEEYTRLAEEQCGLCAICSSPAGKRKLHVDHCHATGKVRGLLCRRCNLGLGYFDDDIEGLSKAMAYLELTANSVKPRSKERA